MTDVQEFRITLTVDDFDAAVRLYRDALGLPEVADWSSEQGRVLLLDAGRATLELSNPAQVRMIDQVETDGVRSPKFRLAFEVDDSAAVTDRLVEGGAELLGSPRLTPWRSMNARLHAPADLQITVFQELDPE